MQRLAAELLKRGLSDYIGLWEIVRVTRREAPEMTDEARRALAIASIRELVEGGFVELGEPTRDGGFAEWALSPGEAMDQIEQEWRTLDRDPKVAEVVWLHNTELGSSVARAASTVRTDRGAFA